MAFEAGTATDFWDVFDKFKTFITTDADLVAASEQWTVNRDEASASSYRRLFLQGPGLAGLDEIYVQMRSVVTVGDDEYNIRFNGADGYNSLVDYNSQMGLSPDAGALCWDTSTPYWFFASGRRFIIILKVGTVYECVYCGLILPYGTTSEYPYPMFIGGTTDSLYRRFSDTSFMHGSFFNPRSEGAWLRMHDGSYLECTNYQTNGAEAGESHGAQVHPWDGNKGFDMRECFDGSYPLIRGTVVGSQDADYDLGVANFGVLDGVFFVPGFSNASENTITEGADTYHVFQSAHLNGLGDFCAILED